MKRVLSCLLLMCLMFGFTVLGEVNAASNDAEFISKTTRNASASYAPYNGVDFMNANISAQRKSALTKAMQMTYIKWTCPADFPTWRSSKGTSNTVTATDGTSSTKFIKGKTYVGIPYSMQWHYYDDVSWNNDLNNGVVTTSSMTGNYYGNGSSTAKGSDCSYFVYLALQAANAGSISYNTTSQMLSSSYYTKISWDELTPGDLFLKSGHVMMFVGMSGSNYAVFESTAYGSKCRYYTYSKSSLTSDGYNCYRYKGFGDANTNVPSCNCLDSYAGEYVCTTSSLNLTIRSGHGSSYSAIGKIPSGATVTVTKASGTSSSDWAHVTYNGVSGYASMEYLSPVGHLPTACLDSVSGGVYSVHVGGWAFDRDDLNTQLEIHVYIGGVRHSIIANVYRPDVNGSHGCGDYHGFQHTITVDKSLVGEQRVDVYAINIGGGSDQWIGSHTVTIGSDTTAPVLYHVQVTDVDATGYTVSCVPSDESSIAAVQFPTWTLYNGQDDLVADWRTNPLYSGTAEGDKYTYRVKISDHNNEAGEYITEVYARDIYGNWTTTVLPVVTIPVDVTVIEINTNTIDFEKLGETYQLEATAYPESATDKTVTWTSTNTAVATVKNGVVMAVGYGTAKIVAKAANGVSATCQVTVHEPESNGIAEQPDAVTAETGTDVQFKVVATGDVVSYKWQYRKIYKWFDTSMAGYNTDTLTVPATGARNGYDYRCTVTFADGTILCTDPAKLAVNTYITDLQNPNDQTVVLGYKGQFTASAQGEGLKYQWEYKRPDGEKWIATAMEGATKPTVYIESTTARDGYQYRCAITDVTGKTVYTDPATMRVLSFTAQPTEKFSPVNGTVQFTVSTSVPTGFTYQWQYSRNGGETWSNTTMTGYNTATLVVEATKARDGYQYRCVLTGSKNSKLMSKTATLHVAEPVTITAQPEGYVGAVGQVAVFEVEASNVYTYQWQYARKGSSVWYTTSAEGNQTNKLSVEITSGRNGYQYRCQITGLDGEIYYTDAAKLVVN